MDFSLRAFLGLFAFIVFTSSSNAADCIPKEEMNDIVATFTQFKDLANKEYCHDGSQTSRLLTALMFMRKTQFDSNMPVSQDEVFSGKFASSWWKYFIGRITKFNVQTNCPKGVGAYVMGFFGGKTMYVCPLMLSDAFAPLDQASVMMHEARHIDGYPHVTCKRGPRKGIQGACDTEIADGGSYAVTVETYAQIAKYAPQVHPASRAYAKASAIIYADEAFDVPVKIDRQQEFMVMTNDRQFHQVSFANGVKTTALGQSPALGRVLMRGEHKVLYPEDKTLPAKYVFENNEGDVVQVPGADVTDYNSQTPEQKAQFVDAHSGTQWGARFFKNKVRYTCTATATAASEQSLPSAPLAILYPNGYNREMRSAFVAMENGSVMEFACSESGNFSLQPANLKLDQPYKRIYKADKVVLGLNHDGRLFQINLANGTSTPVATAFDGQVYELMPHQEYGFFSF